MFDGVVAVRVGSEPFAVVLRTREVLEETVRGDFALISKREFSDYRGIARAHTYTYIVIKKKVFEKKYWSVFFFDNDRGRIRMIFRITARR